MPTRHAHPRERSDRGYSLTEIVVAIAIIGTAVVATLAGLRTAVRATVIDQDHANAFVWLQSASDAINLADRASCQIGRDDVLATYNAIAQATSPPVDWAGTSATIGVVDVEFLGRSSVDADFEWSPSFCFEGTGFDESPLYTQRISLQVVSPEGGTESLQMVKSER